MLVIVLLVCAHLLLIHYFIQNASSINKTISLFTQFGGGLLILYSIDANIGVITQKSLLTCLTAYFKEFPLIKRSSSLEIQSCTHNVAVSSSQLSVSRNPESIEEKIEYLQEQIKELKRDLEQESRKLNEKIDHQSKEKNIQIEETKSALTNLESKINEVTTGGVKVQFFGVLLMVYGALAGYAS